MRLTWEEIQKAYPGQWVLMTDTVYPKGRLDLESAVVIYACKDRWGINRFEEENPGKRLQRAAVFHTGEPVPVKR